MVRRRARWCSSTVAARTRTTSSRCSTCSIPNGAATATARAARCRCRPAVLTGTRSTTSARPTRRRSRPPTPRSRSGSTRRRTRLSGSRASRRARSCRTRWDSAPDAHARTRSSRSRASSRRRPPGRATSRRRSRRSRSATACTTRSSRSISVPPPAARSKPRAPSCSTASTRSTTRSTPRSSRRFGGGSRVIESDSRSEPDSKSFKVGAIAGWDGRHACSMRPKHAGTYHVTARSIAEEHIFRDDRDYHAGIQILAELVGERFLTCHGVCFMATHYHVLGSFEDEMLTAAIRRLNKRYATGFNRRHARRGHVFDAPFVSVEVTTEQHADRLPEYIADNPSVRPWPWSSYDAEFSFVTPLPWLETLESGSATPNQIPAPSRAAL